jgi:hypothetical protein
VQAWHPRTGQREGEDEKEAGVDQPLLYLIDALPYVFRAFFAIRDLRDPQGQPVNAV